MKVLVKDRRNSRKHRKCVLEEGVFSGHTFRTAIDKERLEEDETVKFLTFSHKCREQAKEKQDQLHLHRKEEER